MIVLNADYDMNAVNHQSAYGIMVEKRAVCTGYANAFAMLMNGAGIETITVSSNTHAWNQVRVNHSVLEKSILALETVCQGSDSDITLTRSVTLSKLALLASLSRKGVTSNNV